MKNKSIIDHHEIGLVNNRNKIGFTCFFFLLNRLIKNWLIGGK